MRISRIFAFLILFALPLTAQDYPSLGKTVVSELAAGQYAKVEAQFDAQMQAALPVEKLTAVWQSLVQQAGAFRSIASTRVSQQQGFNVVVVTCTFAKATIDVQIAFDSQQKVAGLYFRPATPAAAPGP